MIEIKQEDGLVLARHIPAQEAWGDGLKFFSQDSDFVQVGTWGYNSGKELLAHAHNPVERKIGLTQEVLYIGSGSVKATIFDVRGAKVAELIAKTGDLLVLLWGGHGYQILEDGTKVLEIKNGPYPGAEADRRRL